MGLDAKVVMSAYPVLSIQHSPCDKRHMETMTEVPRYLGKALGRYPSACSCASRAALLITAQGSWFYPQPE